MERYAIVFAALAVSVSSMNAPAQETGRWCGPDRVYSLDLRGTGWRLGQPFSWQGHAPLATFAIAGGSEHTSCSLFESGYAMPADATQEPLNNVDLDRRRDAAANGWNANNIESDSNALIEGVRVYNFVVHAERPPMRVQYEYFLIATARGPKEEELSFNSNNPTPDRENEAVHRLFSSLRFGDGDNGQHQ